VGVVATGSLGIWYLATNLLLAYIPLLLTYPLLRSASHAGWSRLATWVWAVAWLAFLPNSFYLATDITHLFDQFYGLEPMYAVVTYGLFGVAGVAIGIESTLLVHRGVRARISGFAAYLAAELVLLLSSIAIYLGHVWRINTWDLVLHPVELVQDVAAGLGNAGPQGVGLTLTFFGLLSGVYAIIWLCFFGNTKYLSKFGL
jgi:uncharacterized membrane protein